MDSAPPADPTAMGAETAATPSSATVAAALAAGHHHGASFYSHAAFPRAVRGEGKIEVTADDGLRAVAMGLAAEISAKEHRVVEMAELGL